MLRHFPISEFEQRLHKLRTNMKINNVNITLFTNRDNFYYFTGYTSQFWESPTRPIYLLITQTSEIAIVPSLMEDTIQKTFLSQIDTWNAPCLKDDGISLLLKRLMPFKNGKLGLCMNIESNVRMPLKHLLEIQKKLNLEFIDLSTQIQSIRLVKSEYEIGKIERCCQITSTCFELLSQKLEKHTNYLTERDITREMKILLLQHGVDSIRYMICKSGYKGYGSVVDGPTDKLVQHDEIFVIDTGAVYDEYFCDFDRNYIIIDPNNNDTNNIEFYQKTHTLLWNTTQKAIEFIRPGVKISEIWTVMVNYLLKHAIHYGIPKISKKSYKDGRIGHSLGINLTELPSIKHNEHTIIEKNMVFCIEPFVECNGKSIVHEECIVVTETGCRLLTKRCPTKPYFIKKTTVPDPFFVSVNNSLQKRIGLSQTTNKIFQEFTSKLENCAQIHINIKPTPLYRASNLEMEMGKNCTVFIKDEGQRLGLKSFKPLGSFYAIATLDPIPNVLATMTDGNHGKGVAYVANQLGIQSVIYVPANMKPVRKKAMEELGARVITVKGSYDDAIDIVREEAMKNGWTLVSDTSWKEYTNIPKKITIGYSTIFREINEQMKNSQDSKNPITHLFIQAGVGGLAGTAGLWLLYNLHMLKNQTVWSNNVQFILVEPKDADCITHNVLIHHNNDLDYQDPILVPCRGKTDSIMSGLNCGIPSYLSWNIIKDTVDYYVVIGDEWAKKAMCLLAKDSIVAGESGAAGVAGMLALKGKGILKPNSVILCVNTESDTDPENYKKITKK